MTITPGGSIISIRRSVMRQGGLALLGMTAVLSIVGCEAMSGKKNAQAELEAQDAQAAQLAQAVREQAERLEAMRQEAHRQASQPAPEVIWLDNASLFGRDDGKASPADTATTTANTAHDAAQAATQTAIANQAEQTDVDPSQAGAANVSVEATSSAGSASLMLEAAGRDALLAQLLQRERHEQGDALARAMNVSMLLALAGEPELQPRDLTALDESQQMRVRRFFGLAKLLREQTASPEGAAHYQMILDHLDVLMQDVPLHIRKVELSRSVSSFGVLDPMGTRTFLAGRPQPMIVYVELEHFRAIKGEDGRYDVKLAQELVLYNETDGLAVWRQPRVQIVDESLNRRRDFFVVQRVELPARLGVGKYLLKVTMTDLQGGSIDETSIPIQIVADPSLVKQQ